MKPTDTLQTSDGSPAGRQIVSNGAGIQAVKQRIERAFEVARRGVPSTRARTSTLCRTFALRKTAQHITGKLPPIVGKTRYLHVREAHLIAAPVESVAELFLLCERAITKLNIPSRPIERHEVGE
jgi:hypothetical protein